MRIKPTRMLPRALTPLIITAIVGRRQPLPNLPNDVLAQVISHLSIIDKATKSDSETWANVTNINDSSLHRVDLNFTRELITTNVRAKVNLSSVSRLFRTITIYSSSN